MNEKPNWLLALSGLFNSFPAIYLIAWLVINTLLIAYSFSDIRTAPYVLGFMALSLLPILLWRLIR